eukprot:snap_masked-scaffold_12-processed-gene-7.30-mRNA-1 protein AED:1.00 eAED:1.00 QI:0/-1/0/0/-1/1/1/0/76
MHLLRCNMELLPAASTLYRKISTGYVLSLQVYQYEGSCIQMLSMNSRNDLIGGKEVSDWKMNMAKGDNNKENKQKR